MRATIQNACHWMHDEALLAGNWCDKHLLHDRRFWIALAIVAIAIIGVALLFNLTTGSTLQSDPGLQTHPYYLHW